MSSTGIPAWLRRGLEAGLFAAVLALLTFLTYRHDAVGVGLGTLPGGVQGSIIMALPVLALGVFCVGYPVALAATRSEAIVGSIIATLVAADIVTLVTLTLGERVALNGGSRILPIGLLTTLLAAPAAVAGLAASQLFTRLGFGRRAGRAAAIAATVVATPILVVGVPMLA